MLNLEIWDLSSILNSWLFIRIGMLALKAYILTKPLNGNYSFPEQYSAKHIHHSLAKKEEIPVCLPFQAVLVHLLKCQCNVSSNRDQKAWISMHHHLLIRWPRAHPWKTDFCHLPQIRQPLSKEHTFEGPRSEGQTPAVHQAAFWDVSKAGC